MRVGVSGPSVALTPQKGVLKLRLGKTSLKTPLVWVLNGHWNDRGMPVMTAYAPSIREEEEARGCRVLRRLRMRRWLMADMFSTRGTKRVADEQLEPDPETFDVGESRNDLLKLTPCWTVLVFVLLMIVA